MNPNIIHLDCTLRDGGYYNNWDFDLELVNNYIEAVRSARIDYIEIGFRFFYNKGFKGPYAYSRDEFLNTLDIPSQLNVSVMINATDLIFDGELIADRLDKLVPITRNKSKVSLIRIASTLQNFKTITSAFKTLKNKGYKTAVNIMQISKLSNNELNEIGILASDCMVDIIYFADSLGSISPDTIKNIITQINTNWNGPIGFHAHDNKGLALTNTLQAIRYGTSWVDTTITGMGRGAGNAKTEELVLELGRNDEKNANLINLLKIISKYFIPMKNKYLWGTNLYYYLAAQYSIHPSYIQSILSDNRFREEDILSVIDYFKEEESTKFISDQLESAKNFYHGSPLGTISPFSIVRNREVLIIGSGGNLDAHMKALESFIVERKPLVIALNAKSHINESLIDFRIASNPIRLMTDVDKHLKLPQPLITPASMLPDYLSNKLSEKQLIDYGIGISVNGFEFHETFGILPSQLVLAYALSFVSSGTENTIFLAGFDGYGIGDPRNTEINELIQKLYTVKPNLRLVAITPTQYLGIDSISIYGI